MISKKRTSSTSGFGRCRCRAASTAVGRTLAQTKIGDRLGLSVAAIWRGQQALFAPTADYVLQGGDILLTVGREERVSQLTQEGLKVGRNGNDGRISARGVRFIELLLAPHSPAEGHTIRELEFRKKYRLYGSGAAARRSQLPHRRRQYEVQDGRLDPHGRAARAHKSAAERAQLYRFGARLERSAGGRTPGHNGRPRLSAQRSLRRSPAYRSFSRCSLLLSSFF